MRDTLYRERQLWSGNESVKIRYVSGSFVAGTSALSPGVPGHMWPYNYSTYNSGHDNVKIQYVSGSFVAGTSASLPGVPRQMYYKTYVF